MSCSFSLESLSCWIQQTQEVISAFWNQQPGQYTEMSSCCLLEKWGQISVCCLHLFKDGIMRGSCSAPPPLCGWRSILFKVFQPFQFFQYFICFFVYFFNELIYNVKLEMCELQLSFSNFYISFETWQLKDVRLFPSNMASWGEVAVLCKCKSQ